jgi:protein-S-isoprenylcysteine O-methyltransferase Ste14
MTGLIDRIIDFIYRNAITRKKHGGLLTVLCGLFFFSIVLSIIFLAFVSDKLLGIPSWPPSPANLILSIPLLLTGICLWLWSVLTFIKARGTPVPLRPPPQLVQTGPYTYSRNPMLSGVFLMLFGIGFLFQSLSLVVIYTPLFMGLTFLEFKMIEEPELEKRMGFSYVKYREKTPMFCPYPGHSRD